MLPILWTSLATFWFDIFSAVAVCMWSWLTAVTLEQCNAFEIVVCLLSSASKLTNQWCCSVHSPSLVANDITLFSGLPYDVTNEEALKHEEVQALMEESIQQLRHWSDKFLSLILASLDQIPYGMRRIAKVMYDSLTEKFPSAVEKDVLKVSSATAS